MRISKIRVTALEVARQAGVSQPTVSLVLSRNPKARVAPETRARVLKAAEELGYRPNRLAQGLVHRRSFALGIIVPGFGNPVNGAIISGAERVAEQAGYAVLLCETGEVDVGQHLRALADRQIDGVIIAGISESALADADLTRSNVVLVNQSSAAFSSVQDDSLAAGAVASEHLLGLGHRALAFIGPVSTASAFRLRERGFAQGLRRRANTGSVRTPQLPAVSPACARCSRCQRVPRQCSAPTTLSPSVRTRPVRLAASHCRARCPSSAATTSTSARS